MVNKGLGRINEAWMEVERVGAKYGVVDKPSGNKKK